MKVGSALSGWSFAHDGGVRLNGSTKPPDAYAAAPGAEPEAEAEAGSDGSDAGVALAGPARVGEAAGGAAVGPEVAGRATPQAARRIGSTRLARTGEADLSVLMSVSGSATGALVPSPRRDQLEGCGLTRPR